MRRVLLTAFGPYDEWRENASWLVLQAVLRDFAGGVDLTTRLYPVDFDRLRERMASDLTAGEPFDAAIHLGQAPGRASIHLEAVGQNNHRRRGEPADGGRALEPDGPVAFASRLPLGEWAARLREEGVPARVSRDAGDYLCNAALYWSHYLTEQHGRAANAVFVHVPLDLRQASRLDREHPSMPAEICAYAVRLMLESLASVETAAVSGVRA